MEYYRQSKTKKLQAMQDEQVEPPDAKSNPVAPYLLLSISTFRWPWFWLLLHGVKLTLWILGLSVFRMMTMRIPHGLLRFVPCWCFSPSVGEDLWDALTPRLRIYTPHRMWGNRSPVVEWLLFAVNYQVHVTGCSSLHYTNLILIKAVITWPPYLCFTIPIHTY